MSDPYAVLGLSRGASLGDVRHAYRTAVRRVHPDSAGPAASVDRLVGVQRAYREILSGRLAPERPVGPAGAYVARPDPGPRLLDVYA